MSNYFRNLMFRFQQFMIGRYGFDELGKFTAIVSLAGYVISGWLGVGALHMVSSLLLIWTYFRFFSKKIYKRREELNKYLVIKNKVMGKFRLKQQMWRERNAYKYFKCPKCKSVWRFPKGKGKIEITCRSCKTKMIKRT